MSSIKIFSSRLPVLEQRFRKINKLLYGQGQVGYKITGTSRGKYTDANGQIHNDGLYFNVETEGDAKFANMQYLGKIDITGSDTNTIRPFNNINDNEFNQLANAHGLQCDCCGASRNRNTLYAFRCTETSTNAIDGKTYEKGKVYTVGSSCINKFTGVDAQKLIETLGGEADLQDYEANHRDYKPSYVDAKKFMMYAMAIADLQLDEAFTYYKNHSSIKDSSVERAYDTALSSPVTYRKLCYEKDNLIGNIGKTARAAYHLCEDGYVDKSFFRSEDNVKMFKDMMKITDFENVLNKMSSKADDIKKIFSDDIESDDLYLNLLNHNVSALAGSEWIHDSHAQKLVDVCDTYYLSHGSCEMHETLDLPYSFNGRTHDVSGYINGIKADIIDDCYYCHYFNSKELRALYNGFPVAGTGFLTDEWLTNDDPSGNVVSFYQHGNKCELVFDERFISDGKIDRKALAAFVPDNMPTNERVTTTLECVKSIPDSISNKPLSPDMKTGLDGDRYKTIENAISEVNLNENSDKIKEPAKETVKENIEQKNPKSSDLHKIAKPMAKTSLKHINDKAALMVAAKKSYHYYNNSNLVKGAGQFVITTYSESIRNNVSRKANTLASIVNEKFARFNKKEVSGRIMVTDEKIDDKKHIFNLIYTNYPEDHNSAKLTQKYIADSFVDMYHDTLFHISNAKAVSDTEIVDAVLQKDTEILKRSEQKMQKYNVSLDESLLPKDTTDYDSSFSL